MRQHLPSEKLQSFSTLTSQLSHSWSASTLKSAFWILLAYSKGPIMNSALNGTGKLALQWAWLCCWVLWFLMLEKLQRHLLLALRDAWTEDVSPLTIQTMGPMDCEPKKYYRPMLRIYISEKKSHLSMCIRSSSPLFGVSSHIQVEYQSCILSLSSISLFSIGLTRHYWSNSTGKRPLSTKICLTSRSITSKLESFFTYSWELSFTRIKIYSTRIFQTFTKINQLCHPLQTITLCLPLQISLPCKANQKIDISFCFGKDSQVVSALFTVISSSSSLPYISWEWQLSD